MFETLLFSLSYRIAKVFLASYVK